MGALIRLVSRRVLILLASVVVASVVVFGFMSILPGDPAKIALGIEATPEAVAELQERFGTDRPLVVQYTDWATGVPTGEFGTSYVTGAEIGDQISKRIMITAWLVVTSVLIALIVAIPLGIIAALNHRRLSGLFVSGLSQIGVAIPGFVMGIVLIYLFAIRYRWLPSGGWTPYSEDRVDFLKRLALPALSLGVVQGAVLTRYVRSAFLDVLSEDYMRTARAKGTSAYSSLIRHGLRNASIPVVTVLGLQITTLFVGAVVIERVFVIPGLGSLLLDGVANRDLLLVQGVVMVLVVVALIINFIVDVLYLVLDPRLRAQ